MGLGGVVHLHNFLGGTSYCHSFLITCRPYLRYIRSVPSCLSLPTASVNTAVDVEYLSGYLTCLNQVEDSVHNVLYVCDSSHWLQLFKEVLGIILVHWRIHHARSYSVEADTLFCILNRETPND